MKARADYHATEDEAYRDLRQRLLPGPCEVCGPMHAAARRLQERGQLDYQLRLTCTKEATELHHLRKRSSSGAIADEDNVRRSCFNGNQAVEAEPDVAREAGMVLREGDADWDRFSSRAWRKAHQPGVDDPAPEPPPPRPPATVRPAYDLVPDPF